MLLAVVVGSGIMGERLAGGDLAMALLANSIATGAELVALILAFGPVSGALFNPAVSLAEAWTGGMPWLIAASTHARAGASQAFSELVATFGLLAVIRGCSGKEPRAVPFAVGAYIAAAYWFTASTSFANPAVTLARRDRYVRRDQTAGRAAVRGRAGRRRRRRDRAVSLAGSAKLGPRGGGRRRSPGRRLSMKTIVFACVHNAGRSQMAAALFNRMVDPAAARAVSAGTRPAERVHPEVVEAMAEVGIDLSSARPRLLTDELAADAALLVTMGCGDQCPVVPGLRRDDWPLDDPRGQPVERVREIRDDIRRRVADLLDAEGWSAPDR